MKKLKIMLLSLALFAVIGGALAFKAKYTSAYCTRLAIQDAFGVSTCSVAGGAVLTCPNYTTNKKLAINPAASAKTWCTTNADVDGDCSTGDNDDQPINCVNATTSIVANP